MFFWADFVEQSQMLHVTEPLLVEQFLGEVIYIYINI